MVNFVYVIEFPKIISKTLNGAYDITNEIQTSDNVMESLHWTVINSKIQF